MRNWREYIEDTQGTTMVEVMVAFTVLVLVMGIFSQALTLAGRMMNRADDTMDKSHELVKEYYMGELSEHSDTKTLEFKTDNGESFTVEGTIRRFSDESGTIYDVIPTTE